MQKSIRQSMAWLHSWLGLLFAWLILAIFLMGTLSYYRQDINLWMQPQLTTLSVEQPIALSSAYDYLQKHAPDAKSWFISPASAQKPVNQMYWQNADLSYGNATLDPITATPVSFSATMGADFFYQFHFQLFGMPILIGRLIASIAAFMMLIILISGIITHKKILTDFFTFRTAKGARSYLDFHNVSAVIALPFFLTVTFTGLTIFFYVYLPAGLEKHYPENTFQYFDEMNNTVNVNTQPPNTLESPPVLAQMQPIAILSKQVQQQWGDSPYATVSIKNPNTTQAQITFTALEDPTITRRPPQMTLNAMTGEVLADPRNNSPIATLNAGVYGLHMAKFAPSPLRLALFFCGLLGYAMIASGLLLWSLKREKQQQTRALQGQLYLVNRLNITAILGLPIAVLCYFYCNKIEIFFKSTHDYEIQSFFTTWLMCFIISLMLKKHHLWRFFLKIFMVLGISLVIFDFILNLQAQYLSHAWVIWNLTKIDLFILLFCVLAYFLHQKIRPIPMPIAQP